MKAAVYKRIAAGLLTGVMLGSAAGCSAAKTVEQTGRQWGGETVQHDNFTDLGNYVIELPDYTDASALERGISLTNDRYDHGDISRIGCTVMVTTNDAGEVVVGRNMDVEISQYPALIFKTTFGKYETFGVTYTADSVGTYAQIQQMDALDESYVALLPFTATDVFNEKGLYIEANMRTSYSGMSNYGLHSAHGETTRDDGTPWSELRACTMTLPQLVGQNCATVEEALEFIRNSYDWYTLGLPTRPHYDGWNMCFIIGDATGEYGLIEIAQDTVSYLPYQNGQANYYLTPQWGVLDTCGSGYGRLAGVYERLNSVQTLEQAMDAMKPVMWRNETLWIGESFRADSSTNPNPYNQIVFRDDSGGEQLDWRSDYVALWPVLDDGRLLVDAAVYENAGKSTYDPKIAEYFEDALAAGTLVVDDGSVLFDVNGEELTLTQLRERYEAYEELSGSPEQETMRPYYDAYHHLLFNENAQWVLDDHNFEALKACAYEMLHTRYDEQGNYDPNAMSKYEKLKAFYGYGVEKDEAFLRDDASIWTTSLNIGVNCAQKQMKIRFWENDDVIYSVAW